MMIMWVEKKENISLSIERREKFNFVFNSSFSTIYVASKPQIGIVFRSVEKISKAIHGRDTRGAKKQQKLLLGIKMEDKGGIT